MIVTILTGSFNSNLFFSWFNGLWKARIYTSLYTVAYITITTSITWLRDIKPSMTREIVFALLIGRQTQHSTAIRVPMVNVMNTYKK